MTERVFNVGMLEVVHVGDALVGKRWISLRFGYAGDDSPLIVQMPETAWTDALVAEHVSDWADVDDEWNEAIRAAHPARSESHDEYGVAMQMVGHRHSKGALVALVNWLLVEKAKLNAGHQESERQFQAKCDEIGALLGKVDELTAQRDAFGQKAYELQEEVLRVRALIHLDRTGLAEAIERMVKEAAGRLWVTDGRGPYAWDDERYKDEAGQALRSVIEIGKKALGASGDNADSAFRPEAPRVVMWGGRKMKEGRCPPDGGGICIACNRLGRHLEPAD